MLSGMAWLSQVIVQVQLWMTDMKCNMCQLATLTTRQSLPAAGQADPNGPSCGTSNQNCDVGEFTLSDISFSNVESAFSHGSGQGTVVTMTNFAVTDSRNSCFNFAENTVATLTGTASSPSTMTRCNTNNNADGGAVRSVQGSTAGSLTMEYVNIEDALVSLIRTDLQMITISDVTATMTNGANNYRWTDNGNSGTLYDTTGVSLGLSHGSNSEVVITRFDAQNYAQGWICAASKVSLTEVNLGTGFTTTIDSTSTHIVVL